MYKFPIIRTYKHISLLVVNKILLQVWIVSLLAFLLLMKVVILYIRHHSIL